MAPPSDQPLVTGHALEFPGGYTRSTGPVIGRFLSELRDGRVVGVRTAGGRVLVPPLEYDPDTGDPVTDEFVEVGPVGTVTTWTWVPEPAEGHPVGHPFAWALIELDGADTALVHALDLGPTDGKPPRELRTGMRVRPQWRADRTGSVTDIVSFRPEVTMLVAPSRVEYRLTAGRALTRYLNGVAEGRFLGSRCPACAKVYLPLREVCPACGGIIEGEVEVSNSGRVVSYAINNIPDPRAPDVPFVSANVLLDGSDVPVIGLVAGIPADQVRMGLRVRAVWRPPEERGPTMESLKWFEPEEGADA